MANLYCQLCVSTEKLEFVSNLKKKNFIYVSNFSSFYKYVSCLMDRVFLDCSDEDITNLIQVGVKNIWILLNLNAINRIRVLP